MKYSLHTYLNYNPFTDAERDDTYICQYEWKQVKTRVAHDCVLAELVGKEYHQIPKGEFAMREHAIVEGKWGSTYSCMECMDKWLTEEIQLKE